MHMMDGTFPWPMLIMLGVLVAAIASVFLLVRLFSQPAQIRTTGFSPAAARQPLSSTPIERDAFIVIPDISGYTQFVRLNRFAADHAQYVVAELLGAMLSAANPPLLVTRVEGDSVVFHASSREGDPNGGLSGADVAEAVVALVEAFFRKRGELIAKNLCPCGACGRIASLDVKVVVHRGQIAHYRLHGLDDLAGIAVIEAHRLLKNSVQSSAYVLVSQAAAADIELPWQRATDAHRENYDDVGELTCELYLLDPAEVGHPAARAEGRARDLLGKLTRNVRNLAPSER